MQSSTRYVVIEKRWKCTRDVVTSVCIEFQSRRLCLAGTSIRFTSSRKAEKPYNIPNSTRFCFVESRAEGTRYVVCNVSAHLSVNTVELLFSVRLLSTRQIHTTVVFSLDTRRCTICLRFSTTRFVFTRCERYISANTPVLNCSITDSSTRYCIAENFYVDNRFAIYSFLDKCDRYVSTEVGKWSSVNTISVNALLRKTSSIACFYNFVDTSLMRYCVFNSFSATLRFSVRKGYFFTSVLRTSVKKVIYAIARRLHVNTIDFRYGTLYYSTRTSHFKSIIYNSRRLCEYVPYVPVIPNYLLPLTSRNLITKPVKFSYFTYLKPLRLTLLYDSDKSTLLSVQETGFIRLFSGTVVTIDMPHDRTANYKKYYYIQVFDIYGNNEQQLIHTRLFACNVTIKHRFQQDKVCTTNTGKFHVTRFSVYRWYLEVPSSRRVVQLPLYRIRSSRNVVLSSRHLCDRGVMTKVLGDTTRYIRTKLLIIDGRYVTLSYLADSERYVVQNYNFASDRAVIYKVGGEDTRYACTNIGGEDTRFCTLAIRFTLDRYVCTVAGDIDTRYACFSFTIYNDRNAITKSSLTCRIFMITCEFGIMYCPQCFIIEDGK